MSLLVPSDVLTELNELLSLHRACVLLILVSAFPQETLFILLDHIDDLRSLLLDLLLWENVEFHHGRLELDYRLWVTDLFVLVKSEILKLFPIIWLLNHVSREKDSFSFSEVELLGEDSCEISDRDLTRESEAREDYVLDIWMRDSLALADVNNLVNQAQDLFLLNRRNDLRFALFSFQNLISVDQFISWEVSIWSCWLVMTDRSFLRRKSLSLLSILQGIDQLVMLLS